MSEWMEDWWIEEDKTISCNDMPLWFYSGKIFYQLNKSTPDSAQYHIFLSQMIDIIVMADTLSALKAIGGLDSMELYDDLKKALDKIENTEYDNRVSRDNRQITTLINNIFMRYNGMKEKAQREAVIRAK